MRNCLRCVMHDETERTVGLQCVSHRLVEPLTANTPEFGAEDAVEWRRLAALLNVSQHAAPIEFNNNDNNSCSI